MNEVGCQEQADPDWVGGLGGHPAGEWQSAGQETGVQRRDGNNGRRSSLSEMGDADVERQKLE